MKTPFWAFAQLAAFAPPTDSGAASSTSSHDSADIGDSASSTTSVIETRLKGDITDQRLAAGGSSDDDGSDTTSSPTDIGTLNA